MKKVFMLASLLAFASEVQSLPSWFVAKVSDSSETVYGIGGAAVEKTFTACAFAGFSDEIDCLEKARDKAIEDAYSKIASIVSSDTKGTKRLLHCVYDENPKSGGAFVQVSLTLKEDQVELKKKTETPLDKLRMSSSLPRVMNLEDEKFWKVFYGNFGDAKDIAGGEILEKLPSEKVSFRYVDNTPVQDYLVTINKPEYRFVLKNCARYRKTIIVIPVDAASECDEVTLVYKDIELTEKIVHDTKHVWRNLVFELQEDLLDDYAPEMILKTDGKPFSVGSFCVYQNL